jgi:hypothetical protein
MQIELFHKRINRVLKESCAECDDDGQNQKKNSALVANNGNFKRAGTLPSDARSSQRSNRCNAGRSGSGARKTHSYHRQL